MNVRPLHDKILIKRLEGLERTKGGIYIPDSAKEKPAEGEVVAVGSGRLDKNGKLHPLAVKKGDRVLFQKYGGTEIKVGGEDYLIMEEDSVMAIFVEDESASKKKSKK